MPPVCFRQTLGERAGLLESPSFPGVRCASLGGSPTIRIWSHLAIFSVCKTCFFRRSSGGFSFSGILVSFVLRIHEFPSKNIFIARKGKTVTAPGRRLGEPLEQSRPAGPVLVKIMRFWGPPSNVTVTVSYVLMFVFCCDGRSRIDARLTSQLSTNLCGMAMELKDYDFQRCTSFPQTRPSPPPPVIGKRDRLPCTSRGDFRRYDVGLTIA